MNNEIEEMQNNSKPELMATIFDIRKATCFLTWIKTTEIDGWMHCGNYMRPRGVKTKNHYHSIIRILFS